MIKFYVIANIEESKIRIPIHKISKIRISGLIKEINFRNVFLNQRIIGLKTYQDEWLFEKDFVKDLLESGDTVYCVLENDLQQRKKKKRSSSLISQKRKGVPKSDPQKTKNNQKSKTKMTNVGKNQEITTELSLSHSYDSRNETTNFENQKINFGNSQQQYPTDLFKTSNLFPSIVQEKQNSKLKEDKGKGETEEQEEKNMQDEQIKRAFSKNEQQDLEQYAKTKEGKIQKEDSQNDQRLEPNNLFYKDTSEDRTIYDEPTSSEGNEEDDEKNDFVFSEFDRQLDENPEKLEKNMIQLNEEIKELKHEIKILENISPTSTIKKESKHLQAPTELCCPLTRKLFVEPVISPYGITFERSVIQEYIKQNGEICPLTKKQLKIEQLLPSITIKSLCDNYRNVNNVFINPINNSQQTTMGNNSKNNNEHIIGSFPDFTNNNNNDNDNDHNNKHNRRHHKNNYNYNSIKKYSIFGLDTFHLFQIPMTIQIIKKSLHLSIYGGETLIEKIHQIRYKKSLTSENNILRLVFLTKKIWIKFINLEQIEEFIQDFELIKQEAITNSKKKVKIF